MAEQNLKEKTAKGLVWAGLSNGVIQVLGALFGIVLLRLLSPGDYGKIAVLIVFSNIAGNLQESGFIAALCNKRDASHRDYNAVFWFGLIVSISMYALLWFCAPLIADFYHEPVLVPLARYLFLGFVIASFGTVQHAYLFSRLMVKQTSLISISALVISNVVGVVMALMGYAFWGLATQSILYTAVVAVAKWYISPWRPSFNIDLRPAWQMFGFSSKLLVTNLFNQLNSQVFSVLLGRFYNPATVGFYSNARKWDDMAMNTINGMVSGTAQPVLSQVADEPSRYVSVFRKMLRFTSFVSFPLMLGLGLVAREFILITVGEKWADSAILLSLLTIHGAFFPITTLYSNMAISRSRSGINMGCTIAQCIIVWCGLIAVSPMGLHAMVVFFVAVNVLWLLVWQWFARRLTGLRFRQAALDILPFFIMASAVMALTWLATSGISNIYLAFAAKVLMAATLYIGIAYASGAKIVRESIEYITKRKQ